MKQSERRALYYDGCRRRLAHAHDAADAAAADRVRIQAEAVAMATGWAEFDTLAQEAAVATSQYYRRENVRTVRLW